MLPFLLRLLIYLWTFPTTFVGLLAVGLGIPTGTRAVWVDGVLEAHGGRLLTWTLRHAVPLPGGAIAITLGHVVLGINRQVLNDTRRHERVHVRQAEIWGPIFIPAYLIAGLFAWVKGRDIYRDNPFESQAFAVDGVRRPADPDPPDPST